jgi:5-oxoprolinase (ATP-hydrolysing) subunit A
MRAVDLNADVGESFGAWSMGRDAELLAFVTSVNVACGFHAGDPQVMDRTVGLAAGAGVAVGAHPGYPDLRGFGRRAMDAAPAEVEADVLYQVGALAVFAQAHGVRLRHVKPHGALYNQAAVDPVLARAIARGVARAGRDLVFVGLAGSRPMREAAEAEGLRFAGEAFVDRRYEPDGTLQSRRVPGSVLTDPAAAAAQAVRLAREGVAVAADGSEVRVEAETFCLHGDLPSALDVARGVREALDAAGLSVRPLGA